jgi:hypothetical protein
VKVEADGENASKQEAGKGQRAGSQLKIRKGEEAGNQEA